MSQDSSGVEREAEDFRVRGSNPLLGTIKNYLDY